jgi:hypothetical protein
MPDTNRILERKERKTRKRRREKNPYQRNGCVSEEVKRLRAKGIWMDVELSERDTDNQERMEKIKEFRYKGV